MSTSLTYIIGWPFVAALLLCLVPRNYRFVMRLVAVSVTFIVMLLAIKLFWRFDTSAGAPAFQFVHRIPWWGVKSLGIAYTVGVDGLNVGLDSDGRDRGIRRRLRLLGHP